MTFPANIGPETPVRDRSLLPPVPPRHEQEGKWGVTTPVPENPENPSWAGRLQSPPRLKNQIIHGIINIPILNQLTIPASAVKFCCADRNGGGSSKGGDNGARAFITNVASRSMQRVRATEALEPN